MTENGRDALARVGMETLFAAAGLPVVGSVVATPLVRRLRAEHERKASVALEAAVRVSGLTSLEDLAEQLEANLRLQPLLVRLLHAAGTNGCDRTLRAVGQALGEATRAPGRVDECDQLLQALDGLTADHATLLEVLDRPSAREDRRWLEEDAERAALQLLQPTAYRLCRASLNSRGLTTEYSGLGGGVTLALSDAGSLVLEVLRQHVQEASTRG